MASIGEGIDLYGINLVQRPIGLPGAIFGRLMTVSGYAEDIARWFPKLFGPNRAVLVTAIVTTLLTYGGVSAWVIAFTIVPIAKPLFHHANVSMRLMPAAIALGIFTFATAALPGSPQIHNAIPTRYFEAITFAAPALGLIGAAVTFACGIAWLAFRERQLARQGEGFVDLSLTANNAPTADATPVNPTSTHAAPAEASADDTPTANLEPTFPQQVGPLSPAGV